MARLLKINNSEVVLRLMESVDVSALSEIAMDRDIWRYFVSNAGTDEGIRDYVDGMVANRDRSTMVPFTIIEARTGRAAGGTAYGNISEGDRRAEIGWSWLGKAFQGTAVNTNAKYLMLRYAFEVMGCERVEFKTDVLNLRARAALKKIGATEEGVLRSHTLMHDGRRRDTIYYGILRNEWESVALHLIEVGATASGWGFEFERG